MEMAHNTYDWHLFGILSKVDHLITNFMPGQKMKTGFPGLKNEISRWDLIFDILDLTQKKKSAIKVSEIQKSYIDPKNFDKYFKFLMKENFIEKHNNGERYYLTKSGEELYRGLREISEILDNKVELLKFIIPAIIFANTGQISPEWAS